MYVGLKQPRGDGERYVTPARAAAKETSCKGMNGTYGPLPIPWLAHSRPQSLRSFWRGTKTLGTRLRLAS